MLHKILYVVVQIQYIYFFILESVIRRQNWACLSKVSAVYVITLQKQGTYT